MPEFLDVPSFRRMISPCLLEYLFWGGIGGVLYGSCLLSERDHRAWWISLVFGFLVTRVLFERAILAFQTYDRLNEIADAIRRSWRQGGELQQADMPDRPGFYRE